MTSLAPRWQMDSSSSAQQIRRNKATKSLFFFSFSLIFFFYTLLLFIYLEINKEGKNKPVGGGAEPDGGG